MTNTPLPPEDEDEALAAEYVLGPGDLAARSAAEVRIKSDPAFAARVEAWQVRLADLNDGFAEAPAPNLLPRIEARLFPAPDPAPTRNAARGGGRSAARGGGRLPWLSGMAVALVLVLATVAMLAPPQSNLVAQLATADNRLAYEIRRQGDYLRVTRTAGVPAIEGQVHELWIIAPGAAPVSLGLLVAEPLVVPYPAPPTGWILAVSIEPEGGSPTGLPTGPVILTKRIGDDA